MSFRKRTQARMLALQALCLFDALGDDFSAQLNEFLRDAEGHSDLGLEAPPNDALAFARTLAAGTWQQREKYDELLNRTVAQWRVERMPPVDRNVLRLGLYELAQQSPDAPPEVVLNEAIELARLFGDTDSPGFVNGVLDAVRKNSLFQPAEQDGQPADAAEPSPLAARPVGPERADDNGVV